MAETVDTDENWSIKPADSLAQQVYDILWKMIQAGELQPLERVSDTRLATRLGVSRSPIREAMSKLEREGILIRRERGGLQVRSVRDDDVRGMYTCRAALEGVAVREAIAVVGDDDVDVMRRTLDASEKMIEQGKFEEAIKLNTEFHDTIVAKCDNYYLIELIGSLQRLTNFNRVGLSKTAKTGDDGYEEYKAHMLKNLDDHRGILQAIADRDPDEAERRMRRHLNYTGEKMSASFKSFGSSAD